MGVERGRAGTRAAAAAALLALAASPASPAARWATFELGDLELHGHRLGGVTVELAPRARGARLRVADLGVGGPGGRWRAARLDCQPVRITPSVVDCPAARLRLERDAGAALELRGGVKVVRRTDAVEVRFADFGTAHWLADGKAFVRGARWRLRGTLRAAGAAPPALTATLNVTGHHGQLDGIVRLTARGLTAIAGAGELRQLRGTVAAHLSGAGRAPRIDVAGRADGGELRLGPVTLGASPARPVTLEAIAQWTGERLEVMPLRFGQAGAGLAGRAHLEPLAGALHAQVSGSVPVLGGTATVRALRVHGATAGSTRVEVDARVRGASLDLATRNTRFGGLRGPADIELRPLVLVDGQPVAGSVYVESAGRGATPRTVAGSTVEALRATLGVATAGAGRPAGPPTRSGYRRFGLGCDLDGGLCTMRGLGGAGDGYLVLDGIGVGRARLTGLRRTVPLARLLDAAPGAHGSVANGGPAPGADDRTSDR